MSGFKWCRYCEADLPLTAFHRRKLSPDGLSYKCIACAKAYDAELYLRDPDRAKAKVKKWALQNPQKRRAIKIKWNDLNKEKNNAANRNRILARNEHYKEMRANNWAIRRAGGSSIARFCKEEIGTIYRLAKAATKVLGVKHVVDHIVPAIHPLVCGLHVPWNLRVVSSRENSQKHNKLIDVQDCHIIQLPPGMEMDEV